MVRISLIESVTEVELRTSLKKHSFLKCPESKKSIKFMGVKLIVKEAVVHTVCFCHLKARELPKLMQINPTKGCAILLFKFLACSVDDYAEDGGPERF